MDKELCKKMVEGATYWDEAATKAITAATQELAKAIESGNPACKKSYKETEEKFFLGPFNDLGPPAFASGGTGSWPVFSPSDDLGPPAFAPGGTGSWPGLMESLETVGTIREGDKVGSLDLKLAAALTSLDDCTKALKGEPDASPAKILNHSVEEAIRVCLAVSSSKVAASSSKSANSNASPSFSLIS
nr:uncharacterized protein LOC109179531 [Ipomoea batatas]